MNDELSFEGRVLVNLRNTLLPKIRIPDLGKLVAEAV